jgi:endo-1,4-beta-xylanase
MKKNLFPILATLLLLAGCARQNSVTTTAEATKYLKSANPNVKMGVAVRDNYYLTWTANYQPTTNENFSRLTSENNMKFAAIRPTEAQYIYNDALINKAKDFGLEVHGHVLAWHNAIPNWLTNKETATPPEQRRSVFLQILKTHITNVVTHYANIKFPDNSSVVTSWDVVNEAFNDTQAGGGRRPGIWQRTIGSDYIDSAFTWARRAANAVGNTSLKLFYNDYGYEYDKQKSYSIKGMIENLRTIREGGLPVIDGVALQMHTNTSTTIFKPAGGSAGNAHSIQEAIELMSSINILLFISELDVAYNNPYGANIPEDQKQAKQNSIYYNVPYLYRYTVPAARRWGITLWSLTDNTSFQAAQTPCVFDASYVRKDLFFSCYGGLTN